MARADGVAALTDDLLRQVFVDSPVSLRVEDFTKVHAYLDHLRVSGASDIGRHFREHPEEVERCARMVQVVEVNRAALNLYGAASRDELLDHLARPAGSESNGAFRRLLEGLAQGRTGVSTEAGVRTLSGQLRSVRLDATVLPKTPDGRRMAIIALTDVSGQRRAERQVVQDQDSQKTLNALLRLALEDLALKELLRHALALVLDNPWPATLGVGAVFLVDEDTRELVLEAHNGIGPQILERCARVPFGRCLCGRVADSGQPVYCEGIDERHEIAYPGILPHGHYCIPIAAGGTLLGVLNVYLAEGHPRDAGEEEFLSAFASTLAGIIVRKRAEQSARLADKQLREQAALVTLGEMAALVAHEVKNPLAGVRGAIQVIGSRLPPGGKDAAIVGEIVARIDALGELMKDLLLFARPPQARPTPVDVAAIARETATLVSEDPTAHGVRVDVEGSAAGVMADAQLLKIVLLNLLLNAAHASEKQGTVRVSVATDDRACRIVVADAGPGIPPALRERIFTPFFTTKPRGTGLGLSTAKRLIDAHFGRISVDCPPEGGTVVTIELPR